MVAERICGIPDSPQGQAAGPSVLLHPDRGNERSARLARYLGDTETPSQAFTQELKDPAFARSQGVSSFAGVEDFKRLAEVTIQNSRVSAI